MSDKRTNGAVSPAGRRRRRADHGSATVAVLVALIVVWACGLLGVAVAQALMVRHQVAASADLAALAGAGAAVTEPPGACAAAARVASANGSVLVSCATSGRVVDLLVERRVRSFGRVVAVRARARAGPAGPGRSVPASKIPTIGDTVTLVGPSGRPSRRR